MLHPEPPPRFAIDQTAAGKIDDYDIDLAAQLARRLGVTMEFVSIINSERIPALQQDRVDLAASGTTRDDNSRHLGGFSVACLVSTHTVIILKGPRHHRGEADGRK